MNNLLKTFSVVLLFLIFTSCDPYWRLNLSDEQTHNFNKQYLSYENFKIEVTLTSIANMGFSLDLFFEYDDSLKYLRINPDSLKIQINGSIFNYHIYPKISELNNRVDKVIYHLKPFDYELNKSDTIIIYAINLLETTKQKYNLDSLKFLVPTDFK